MGTRDAARARRLQPESAFFPGVDGDFSVKQPHALAYALQPQRQGQLLGQAFRRRAHAVVLHRQFAVRLVARKLDTHLRGLGMLGDIGQRFLNHPKQRRGDTLGGFGRPHAYVGMGVDAIARHKIGDQPFHRGGQTQVIQHDGPQVRGNAPQRSEGRLDHPTHGAHPLAGAYVLRRQPGFQLGQFHGQRREALAQVVVQLACDVFLFLFAHMQQGVGQPRQLVARGAQGLVDALAFCDVAQEDGQEYAGVGPGLRDGRFHREFFAVGTQTP